jgi:hypothetical protein
MAFSGFEDTACIGAAGRASIAFNDLVIEIVRIKLRSGAS